MQPVRAADRVLEASQFDQDAVSLTEYFAVLEDPSQLLTLADVRKPEVASRFTTGQAPAEALSRGFTRSAYWLRLTLRNNFRQATERFLEIDYAVLSSIQFHQPMADGSEPPIRDNGRCRPLLHALLPQPLFCISSDAAGTLRTSGLPADSDLKFLACPGQVMGADGISHP